MNGVMVEDMKEVGNKIECMETEFIHGKMVENIKEDIWMIRNMVEVYTSGLMDVNTMECGKTENSMDKDYS